MLGVCKPLIDANELEITQHGSVLFPIGCYHDDLSQEGFPCHWHPELEAAVVTEGSIFLEIHGHRYELKTGDAFFVNAQILHAVFANQNGGTACRLHSFCVHPRLIGGSHESIIWEKYLKPLMNNPALSYAIFDGADQKQDEIITLIEETWQQAVYEPPAYEFTVREKLSKMVYYLWNMTDQMPQAVSEKEQREEARMKCMLEYIHSHYAEEIQVEQLAATAQISKSEVLRCFHSIINTTPIQYVLTYRLRKAATLLTETNWKIIEIAMHCGFQEMSYFSRCFKKVYGSTPREYRKMR